MYCFAKENCIEFVFFISDSNVWMNIELCCNESVLISFDSGFWNKLWIINLEFPFLFATEKLIYSFPGMFNSFIFNIFKIKSSENKTAFDYASENKSLQKDDIYWSLN